MRIKLRLYTRDLDLLSAKQIMDNEFGAAVRKALLEYAERGECSRIYIPSTDKPIVLKNEQVDISLNRSKYQPVVDWLLSFRPGVRNAAVKVVLRSAIANPALFAFRIDGAVIEEPTTTRNEENERKSIPQNNGLPYTSLSSAEPNNVPAGSQIPQVNEPHSQVTSVIADEDDDDFDLIGFDAFDNI